VNGLLLDTHIWLWTLSDDRRLTRGLRRAITAERARSWLSPISIWEIGVQVERGRMKLNAPLRSWVSNALAQIPLREAPITNEVGITVHEIQLRNRDPADYFLAATALVYDLTLLTVDSNLTDATWLRTRSR
jgi:PIN domain nuclease of toxin-antitoxin system